jgi:hypothetical protein
MYTYCNSLHATNKINIEDFTLNTKRQSEKLSSLKFLTVWALSDFTVRKSAQ